MFDYIIISKQQVQSNLTSNNLALEKQFSEGVKRIREDSLTKIRNTKLKDSILNTEGNQLEVINHKDEDNQVELNTEFDQPQVSKRLETQLHSDNEEEGKKDNEIEEQVSTSLLYHQANGFKNFTQSVVTPENENEICDYL